MTIKPIDITTLPKFLAASGPVACETAARMRESAIEAYPAALADILKYAKPRVHEIAPSDTSYYDGTTADEKTWETACADFLQSHNDADWWRKNASTRDWTEWWETTLLTQMTKDDDLRYEDFIAGCHGILLSINVVHMQALTTEEIDKRLDMIAAERRILRDFGTDVLEDFAETDDGRMYAERIIISNVRWCMQYTLEDGKWTRTLADSSLHRTGAERRRFGADHIISIREVSLFDPFA